MRIIMWKINDGKNLIKLFAIYDRLFTNFQHFFAKGATFLFQAG